MPSTARRWQQPWPVWEAPICERCGHVFLNLFDLYSHITAAQHCNGGYIAYSDLAGVTTGLSQALPGRATGWNNIWSEISWLITVRHLIPGEHDFDTNPWYWNRVNDVMHFRGSNRMVCAMFASGAARKAADNLRWWRTRHLNVLTRDRDAWVYPVDDPASGQMVDHTWVYRRGDWWTYIWIDTSRRDGTAVVRKTGHFAWCRLGQNSWVEWDNCQHPALYSSHPGTVHVVSDGAFECRG